MGVGEGFVRLKLDKIESLATTRTAIIAVAKGFEALASRGRRFGRRLGLQTMGSIALKEGAIGAMPSFVGKDE